MLLMPQAGAIVTRTSGTGNTINISWTEVDLDNSLGLPGNTHVGYLYAEQGPYGDYLYGAVTDFDCAPGQTPWGGHHGGHGDVVDEAADVVTDAVVDVIDEIADAGVTNIDAAVVEAAIEEALDEEIPEFIEEEAGCTFLQERYLEGQGIQMTVDKKGTLATLSGSIVVTSAGDGHGNHGSVLGNPPINLTISGGDWTKFEYTSKVKGANWTFKTSQKGTNYDGGTVTGGIGPMGFADDADDESFASFGTYKYETVDRLR